MINGQNTLKIGDLIIYVERVPSFLFLIFLRKLEIVSCSLFEMYVCVCVCVYFWKLDRPISEK